MERLKIDIAGMEIGRHPFTLTATAEGLDLLEWIHPVAPLDIIGTVDKVGDTLTVRGKVEGRVEETCGRCTRPFQRELSTEFLVYSDRAGSDDPATSEELERDGHLVYHDGKSVDMTDAVREAIILDVPMAPLCREDCRGYCPGCGADLNSEECRCQAEREDPRWAPLRRLKKDED